MSSPAPRLLRAFGCSALSLLLGILFLSGCAGSAETAASGPAAVGTWAYRAETQQGTYRGTLRITEAETGALQGSISVDDGSVGPLDVEGLTYRDSTLTFDIDGASVGPMDATIEVRGDRLEGSIDVGSYGTTIPFSATKQPE
jgi:hypothetical protein